MSHSGKDDFENDPFKNDDFGSDPFSENGKTNDPDKSGDEPSFDELFGNFESSSEPLDFSDFGGGTPDADGASADGADDTDQVSFDDLLNDSSAPQKDDTLAGLAGLEDLFGGKADAGEDTASRLGALKPEETAPAESGAGSESTDAENFDADFSDFTSSDSSAADGANTDFDLDFNDLNTESGAGSESAGAENFDADFSDFASSDSSAADGAAADLDFGDLDIDGTASAENAGGDGFDTDFSEFISPGDSAAGANGGSAGEEFNLDSDLIGGFGDDSLEASEEAPTEEGSKDPFDFPQGTDDDFLKSLEGGDVDFSDAQPAREEEGGSLPDDLLGGAPAAADDTAARLGDLENLFGGSGAEPPADDDTASGLAGLSAEADAETGLDSDFFKSLQGTGGGEDSVPSAGNDDFGADLKPEFPDFADTPETDAGESVSDVDFDFGFAAPESGENSSAEGGTGNLDTDFSDFAETPETNAEDVSEGRAEEASLDDLLGGTPAAGDDTAARLGGLEDMLGGDTAGDDTAARLGGLEDMLGGDTAGDDTAARLGGLEDMLGGDTASDDTAARLGGLEDMLGGDTAGDDTASGLAGLSAEAGGETGLDSDFFGNLAGSAAGADGSGDTEDTIDTKTEPADDLSSGGGDAGLPSFDDDGADDFAALNTGDSGEGESTTAALAGFEGLVSPDGPAAGDDTAALLGALTGEGEPAKDESTTAGLAGLEGLLGAGGEQNEETAVRLSRLADEQEEDESPDERTLDDFLADGDGPSGDDTGFPAFDDAGLGDEFGGSGLGDEFGGGSGDDSGPADDLTDFTGGGDGFGDEFGALPAEDALTEEEESEPAESGKSRKGKKKGKEPKKRKSSRRRKPELNDPVSRLLTIPQVFFVLYLILGNVKGIWEWHSKGAEFFTLPFFLLAFNGTGVVLFLLPALLRAFRKRYAEDAKLTEYTLFMFMLAMAVAAMIMACHPLIFDLARNWGGPH